MNPDAKLETESEDGNSSHIPDNLGPQVYHPVVALRKALVEWVDEFVKHKPAWGPIVKPQIISVPVPLLPSVNTCISLTSTTTTTTTCSLPRTTAILPSAIPNVPTVNCSASELNAIVEVIKSVIIVKFNSVYLNFILLYFVDYSMQNVSSSFIPPTSTTVMNSFAADNKVICADTVASVTNTGVVDQANSSDSDITEVPIKPKSSDADQPPSSCLAGLEPMDCNATPPNRSPPQSSVPGVDRAVEDVPMGENNERTSVSKQRNCVPCKQKILTDS